MTWTAGNNNANEAAKIRNEVVPFMRGVALDIGAGPYRVWPHFISVDSCKEWGRQGVDVVVETAERLPLFASASVDCCFSSHLLEHIKDYKAALKEWWRVLKPGGFLVLYLPDEDEYPKVGQIGANPDHKWNVNYDLVVEAMEEIPGSWDLIQYEKRSQADEYSLFFVFAKL